MAPARVETTACSPLACRNPHLDRDASGRGMTITDRAAHVRAA
jgi:hypothetical protein